MIEPPRRLCARPAHPDYHPSFPRVGVRIDGRERSDVLWYDVDRHLYHDERGGMAASNVRLAETIEPYFRYPETRQQRRARERWEASHKKD